MIQTLQVQLLDPGKVHQINIDAASNPANRKRNSEYIQNSKKQYEIRRTYLTIRHCGIPPQIVPRASLELEMLHQDLIWNDFMNMVVDLV